MSSWYYADNGRQAGPVDDAALDSLIAQGAVKPDTLIWREGMANWQPLTSARPMSQAVAPAPPPPAPAPVFAPPPPAAAPDPFPQPSFQQPQPQAYQPQQPQAYQPPQPSFQQPQPQTYQPQPTAAPQYGGAAGGSVTCANCGQLFSPNDVVFIGSSYVCAMCKPVFLQRMREGGAGAGIGVRRYAGFWMRFAAALIDGIIIGIAGAIVTVPLTFAMIRDDNPMASLGLQGLLTLFRMALGAAYSGYFLSTKGATPGKQMLGIKVIRSDGSGLSFARGAARYFAQMVSAIILLLGYIIAAFDSEKRALHDHLCDTRVISTK